MNDRHLQVFFEQVNDIETAPAGAEHVDAIGAGVDADRGEIAPADDALCVDDKQRALGNPVVLAVDAVGPRDGPLGLEVRQQGELQLPVAGEGDVTGLFSLRENAIAKEPGSSYFKPWRCVSRLGL